jgi:hypothetical protein
MGAIPEALPRAAGVTPLGRLAQPDTGATRRRRAVSRIDTVVRHIFWIAFAVRVVVGIGGYIATEHFDIPLLQDALYYEEVGYSVAQAWLSGESSQWLDAEEYGGKVAWLMVATIGGLYFLLQGFRSVPILLVLWSLLTAWVPVYAYRIGMELGAPSKVSRRAAWIVALTPAFVFWSGSLYKEGLVLLVLSIGAYHTLRLQRQWSAGSLLAVILSVSALLGLRFYLASLLGGAILLGLLFARDVRATKGKVGGGVVRFVRQATLAAVFLAAMIFTGFTERSEQSLLENQAGLLMQVDSSRRDLAAAQSGYLTGADVSEPEEAIRFFPLGLLYFLTVPFPWQFGGLRQTLTIPETLAWVLSYPLVLVGIIRGMRVNGSGTAFLVILTAAICSVFAVLSGNVGTAYRMRTQVWLFWAPFAVWGWEVWRERLRERRAPARERRFERVARHPAGGPAKDRK